MVTDGGLAEWLCHAQLYCGDWVIKGSSPALCNILYNIFGSSLVPSRPLWLTPSSSRSTQEQTAAPGVANVLLLLSALLELPGLWRHWEHKGFFLMLTKSFGYADGVSATIRSM